ncbi:MAG: BamA/TamA family outer membrane protein [Saprospiraceae bacterium]
MLKQVQHDGICFWKTFTFLFLLPFSAFACPDCSVTNDTLTLQLSITSESQKNIIEKIDYETTHFQIPTLQKTLNQVVTDLQSQAYLTASIDSISRKGNEFEAFLFVGEQYRWAELNTENIDELLLSKIGFREKLYQDKAFDYQQVVKLKNAILDYYENNGFPFASVKLSSIDIQKDKIKANLSLDKGPLILINSIELVKPIPNLSVGYLENYLGIKKGDLYSEVKIKAIRKRLQELPFIKERQSVRVLFVGNSAKIYLFLNKQKASQFDFLIGFLPQNEETGRLTLTGNVQLYFQNILGKGELIDIKWQQLRPLTPQLDLRLAYPYILNLPLGVDVDFHLYRRDTTYIDINYNLGVQYLFEGGNYVKVFLDNFQTNVLTINEQQVINTRQLPRTLDVNNATFGLEWQQQNLDYRFNPRKGLSLKLRGGAGIKRIDESNLIAALSDSTFDYTSLYDNIQTRSVQLRLQGEAAYFIPFGSRGTVKVGVQSGGVLTQDSIYQNELYRIGGNQILRGFDEESIFSSLYAIGTIEGRLLTGQNAYLFSFFDFGYMQNKSVGRNITDFPFGFGLGLTLELGAGVLTFSVASGRQLKNPINFQATKIHVGFVSFF